MKLHISLLLAGCLAIHSCDEAKVSDPESENNLELTKPAAEPGQVSLLLNKTKFGLNDTIVVTLVNGSGEPVFLAGCSQFFISTETDTGWNAAPLVVCFWEGYAVKIPADGVHQEKHPAKYFAGRHRFEAPVFFECLDGEPISQAECGRQEVVFSPVFTVGGSKPVPIRSVSLE